MSNLPQPRKGLLGLQDRILGPRATPSEQVLVWAVTLISPVLLLCALACAQIEWSGVQKLVGAILVADLAGGVVANSTNAAKAWWHREGQGFKEHLMFNAAHIHPFIIAWLFLDNQWDYAVINYMVLIASTVFLFRIQMQLQRPSAFLVISLVLIFNISMYPPVASGFMVLYFMKLIAGHLLYERV